MDIILVALTLSLIVLNWGIYTRLKDASSLTRQLQLQPAGGKVSLYLMRLFKNMIASSMLFVAVIVAILMFLPIMYKLTQGLATLPLIVIFNSIGFIILADLYASSRHLWRRSESLVKTAKKLNVLSAILTLAFLYNAF